MDILFLLIPLSVVLVLVIMVVFWWALHSGQFDHLDGEAERILEDSDLGGGNCRQRDGRRCQT